MIWGNANYEPHTQIWYMMMQSAHGHFLMNLPREREVFNILESINVWPLFTFMYAVCLIEKASLWLELQGLS